MARRSGFLASVRGTLSGSNTSHFPVPDETAYCVSFHAAVLIAARRGGNSPHLFAEISLSYLPANWCGGSPFRPLASLARQAGTRGDSLST